MDRIIQQAIVQVITPLCEPHFQETSYGFRSNRSCEMAILKLLDYLNDGYTWIVDIDLEKFFNNVPQDRLMSYVHNITNDGDTESLIRKYLQAGVIIQAKYHDTPVVHRKEVISPHYYPISCLMSWIRANGTRVTFCEVSR